jgi:hypothetical protein
MADEIKVPDFNLGDDFSESGETFQPKTATTDDAESPKQKPKLLFEDEEEEVKQTPKVKHEESTTEEIPEKKKKVKEPKEKKPKRIWIFIIPILIIIIAGGSFFLQTQGYFDFGSVFVEAGKMKNKIFGKKDTLSVAIHDSSKAKPAPAANTYENELLRKSADKEKEPVSQPKSEQPKTEVKQEKITEKSAVQKSVPPVKEPVKNRSAEIVKGSGKFSVQISAWKLKSKAEMEAKKIKAKGLEVNLVPVTLPQKGGTWYRVMVGSYPSMEAAKSQLDKIKKTTNSENCIVREN